MSDANSAESPLEAAAGRAGPHATEAFALLGNETRLAILLALWEAYEPGADDAVPFSELYEKVDYDNPGNFSYHLQKLEGPFVRKTGEGYELRSAGLKLVRTVIAGAGVENTTVEPTEIDWDCWLCGAKSTVTYRDGTLYQICTECEGLETIDGLPGGLLNAVGFDPAGLTDRSPEEQLTASGVATFRHIRTMMEGLCSACSGPVDASLERCEDHDQSGNCPNCGRKDAILASFQCRVCKDYHFSIPTILAVLHPAVVAYYYEHGVPMQWHAEEFESIKRTLDLIMEHHEMELVSEEPLRVQVTIGFDGDELRLTYDETVTVVDVCR